MRKFGKSAKNFFYRKKIQLQLSKSGGFLIKFLMGNRHFFSLKILSDEAQVIYMCAHFGFCDVMSLSGKKFDFKFEIMEISV